jgi:hypothetical protein
MFRLQVRQRDGRILETIETDRVGAEHNAWYFSRQFRTESWVVGTDGTNCKHWVRGEMKS